jgi:uncharacterized protein (UPF0335 family)
MTKPAEAIGNTSDVKSLLERANNLENELQEIKEAKKDLMAEVKAAGLKTKEFNVALRIKRNTPPKEFTDTVNSYLEAGGQMAFFV